MSTDSDFFISEVLKLYDTYADHRYYDYVQQTNASDLENITTEPTCTISQLPPMISTNKECGIECLQLLHTHLKALFDQPGFLGGYERAFITLFGQDVEKFTITMVLYLDQLQQQLENEEFS